MGETVRAIDLDLIASKPDGWDAIKLRQAFMFSKGLNITKEDLAEDGIPVISYGQIHSKTNTGTGLNKTLFRYVPEMYLRRGKSSLARKNDFLFADTSEDYAGIGNCVFVDSDDTIFAGYHTIIGRPLKSSIIPKYLAYLFQTDFWRSQIRAQVMGVKVFSVTQALLRNIFVLVPPIEEQRQMIAILDRECAKIDSIISDLEQQIAILRHFQECVISEAVSKGINRQTSYIDSNISWIGKIPSHWRIKKVRYLGFLQNGISKDAESFGSGFPFISYGDVYNNRSIPENVRGLVESSAAERRLFSVHSGDVFFTRTSETIEEIGIASTSLATIENATYAGFLIRFRPTTNELYPGYSKYYFRAQILRRYFVKEMMIVTRASLGQNLLKNLPVILPPIPEQEEISHHLDKKCSEIGAIIANKEQQLSDIRKCRQSLIFEYVTGKKRVKEVLSHVD